MAVRIVATCLLAIALHAAPARAAEGDPYLDSCLTGAAVAGCATDPFVDGPFASATSGDGKHVYVGVTGDGSTRGHGIVQFDRSASGALVRHAGVKGCVTSNGNPSDPGNAAATRRCQEGSNLGPGNGMHVVGNSLYFTTLTGNALLVFDIDPATGELTQKAGLAGCIHNGAASGGCGGALGLAGPGPMATKADGSELYVRTGYGLAVFGRTADGTLTQEAGTAGCWHEDGGACSNGAGLASGLTTIRQIAVVDDHLYVPFSEDRDLDNPCSVLGGNCPVPFLHGGVGVFSINADGTLAQASDTTRCVSNNGESGIGDDTECTATGRDEYAFSSTVAGAGDDVYLGHQKGVDHFRRGAGGELVDSDASTVGHRPAGCVGSGEGCTAANAVAGPTWLGLSPDGSDLVVAEPAGVALGFLHRDTSTGTLTPRADPSDCVSRTGSGGNCQVAAALGAPASLVFSPDGLMLYGTGNDHDSIVAIDRDFAPTCQAGSAGVALNASVVVPLACSDPNGDAVTLEITQPAVNGALAGVDQANATVRYTPAPGYSGPDAFEYRGVTRGGAVAGPAARVSIDVQPPPVPPPAPVNGNGNGNVPVTPPAMPPAAARVTSFVESRFDTRNRRFTKVRRLDVVDVIAGTTVEVRCRGEGCRFTRRRRTFTVQTPTFAAARYFNFRRNGRTVVSKLRKGARIQVRITAPGRIGKLVTLTMRRGKKPALRVRDLGL